MRSHIELIGRLSATPEIRDAANGARVAHLTVETTETWTDRTTGERRTRTTWHDVRVAKSGVVKAIERGSHAGDLVFVAGTLRYSEWTDQQGIHRRTAEVAVKANDHLLLFLSSDSGEPAEPATNR